MLEASRRARAEPTTPTTAGSFFLLHAAAADTRRHTQTRETAGHATSSPPAIGSLRLLNEHIVVPGPVSRRLSESMICIKMRVLARGRSGNEINNEKSRPIPWLLHNNQGSSVLPACGGMYTEGVVCASPSAHARREL